MMITFGLKRRRKRRYDAFSYLHHHALHPELEMRRPRGVGRAQAAHVMVEPGVDTTAELRENVIRENVMRENAMRENTAVRPDHATQTR